MTETEFAALMKTMAGAGAAGDVPDAEVIWWRAQLRRRLKDEERAKRPVRVAERIAWAACVLVEAVLVAVWTARGL